MPFSNIFSSGQQQRNLKHFSFLVNVAAIDGEINEAEEKVLRRLSKKLDIGEENYQKAIEHPEAFPVDAPNSIEERLESLYEILKIIFADHAMDDKEQKLLEKYAVALGFSDEASARVINRSVQILSGQVNFDDYRYLLDRETE